MEALYGVYSEDGLTASAATLSLLFPYPYLRDADFPPLLLNEKAILFEMAPSGLVGLYQKVKVYRL